LTPRCIVSGDGCHWLTVDGFEVLGARYDGIKLNGDHNVVRNCWVHHNTQMGIAMHHVLNGTIENNLIEFNGCHVQFDHGVYADGDGLTVRGNIVRHNAAFGLHLYPSLRDWNCGRAIVADIIPFKGRLPLYWATRDPALKIQMQGVAAAPLESDFARDKWTQFNLDGPILKPELPWEGQCIEAAAMAEHSGRPYMFDAGNNDQGRSWYLSAMPVDWKEGMPVLAEDKPPRG
jgi:hypothetical protein